MEGGAHPIKIELKTEFDEIGVRIQGRPALGVGKTRNRVTVEIDRLLLYQNRKIKRKIKKRENENKCRQLRVLEIKK